MPLPLASLMGWHKHHTCGTHFEYISVADPWLLSSVQDNKHKIMERNVAHKVAWEFCAEHVSSIWNCNSAHKNAFHVQGENGYYPISIKSANSKHQGQSNSFAWTALFKGLRSS